MITRQPNCVVSKFYRKPLIRQYQLSFQGTASAGPNAIIHFFSLQPQCHTLIMIQVIVMYDPSYSDPSYSDVCFQY